ncbi:MAG: lysophospholipid acyltransferase family protein [Phycisphaerales bacterium]|nr:lysophospholipid acyltransferase family protein [Phycisphaerales bacterium]
MAKKKRIKIPGWLHAPISTAIRSVLSAPLIAGFDASAGATSALARMYCGHSANRKRMDRAIEHLRQAFPDWTDDHRRAVAIGSYEHLFTLGVEMAFTTRCLTEDSWPAHVRIGEVEKGLAALLSAGPTILLTGHCGNWEVLGYTMALLGFRVHALYRPLDLRPLDAWVRRTRESRGLTLVDKFGAADRLPGILAAGHPLGFVADQNAGDRGLFVPFFGRLASTYKSIGLLAMQFQAPIACGIARRIRKPGGLRYRLDVTDVIRPQDWADAPDPLFYITARYRRAIEQTVLTAPEQYLWMHRIWKSRPRHERLNRPFPPALRAKLETLPWMTSRELDRIVDQSARDARLLAAP